MALPGGDTAARFPWRMALIYLHKTFGDELFNLPISFSRNLDQAESWILLRMAMKGVNSPLTSSCGRLFDAVSALLGLRQKTAYEGQAALELEMCQSPGEKGHYPWQIKEEGNVWVMMTTGIIRGIVEDIEKGEARGVISARFHNSLIGMLKEICVRIMYETGIEQVALSGGSFQNTTLLTGLAHALKAEGLRVYGHETVPANDGSLSLGQAVCAGLIYSGFKGEFQESYEIH